MQRTTTLTTKGPSVEGLGPRAGPPGQECGEHTRRVDLEVEREKEVVELGRSGGISLVLTRCLHGDRERRLLGSLLRRQLTGRMWMNGIKEKREGRMARRFLGSVQ